MGAPSPVYNLPLPLVAVGKVRELYDLNPSTLLFVATDRISAYDVILTNGVPQKGKLLTKVSAHWFRVLQEAIPDLKTHLVSTELPGVEEVRFAREGESEDEVRRQLDGRCMIVKKLPILPIESIVRGYITGSAWAEYKKSGTVHGIAMPEGLKESEKLDKPIWTPSTKAEQGEHDENISPEAAAGILGKAVADAVEKLSLQIYKTAADYAEQRGIIIADTKFEFGYVQDSSLPGGKAIVLVDEVLTPDSSRFWDREKYAVGRGQDSLDKQVLRDWLTSNRLKGKVGVEMSEEVLAKTRGAYVKAYESLTGQSWDA